MIGPITAEKVVEVALNPDDELRNQQVALLYSLSSERLRRRLSDAGEPVGDANWFTIAQWAVLTVGRNLRTSSLPHRAERLPSGVRRRVTPALLSVRAAADRRVAAALSFGQVQVLCSVYHALLTTEGLRDAVDRPAPGEPTRAEPSSPTIVNVRGDTVPTVADLDSVDADHDDDLPKVDPDGPTPATIDDEDVKQQLAAVAQQQFAELQARRERADHAARERRQHQLELASRLGIGAGDLPDADDADFATALLAAIAGKTGHVDTLHDAFTLYREAREHGSGRSRSDLIFEANLRIAAVEQLILDDAVTMVVDHVPTFVADRTEEQLVRYAERTLRVPRRIARVNASRRLWTVSRTAQELWARLMTDLVMVVALPTETIRLGRDMPHRQGQDSFYAPALRTLSPEAQRVFDQFDRSLRDGRGAGAGDWRRFDDRMNFVANLLRSRQQDPTLFWRPFVDEDAERVWNGRYPARTADPFEQSVRAPDLPAGLGGAR